MTVAFLRSRDCSVLSFWQSRLSVVPSSRFFLIFLLHASDIRPAREKTVPGGMLSTPHRLQLHLYNSAIRIVSGVVFVSVYTLEYDAYIST